jgi:hypothetical protein
MKTYKDLRRHSLKRMRHRFDVKFTSADYADAVACIVKQKQINRCVPLSHIEKQSSNRSLWLLSVNNIECIAAFDNKRKAIATFMPKEWFQLEL